MITFTLSRRGFFDSLIEMLGRRTERRAVQLAAEPEDTRVTRELVQEMLSRSPEAFSGEMDVQTLMQCLPGRI